MGNNVRNFEFVRITAFKLLIRTNQVINDKMPELVNLRSETISIPKKNFKPIHDYC